MNIELLTKVRDAIADEANAFDMGTFGVGVSQAGEWWPVDEIDNVADHCGTPACIAGWVIRLGAPFRPEPTWRDRDADAFAISLAGFDDFERLMYVDRWPKWAQEALERDADERDVAVSILECLINDENPWEQP